MLRVFCEMLEIKVRHNEKSVKRRVVSPATDASTSKLVVSHSSMLYLGEQGTRDAIYSIAMQEMLHFVGIAKE